MVNVDLVVVDLDDTCYPQHQYLNGVWAHLGAVAAQHWELDADSFAATLAAVCAERGSDGGSIIDTAAATAGLGQAAVSVLVDEFARWVPRHLDMYDGAADALGRLGELGEVVILTDGNPAIQHAKVAALSVDALARVVVSDEHGGRAARKPNPTVLAGLCAHHGVDGAATVVIGDRPDKDIEVAHRVGAYAIRVRIGEHAAKAMVPGCSCASVATLADAARLVEGGALSRCGLAEV